MIKETDYIHKTFNHLLILSFAPKKLLKSGRYSQMVNCKCDCGNLCTYKLYDLRIGHSKSCGCNGVKKHGLSHTSVYKKWKAMISRCRYSKLYISKGIIVCDEWKDNAVVFITWALDNGFKEGLELDRRDNNGIYEPGNCRFVTRSENQRNKSNNALHEYNGEINPLTEWADILNINVDLIRSRIRIGWDFKRAVETPVNKHFKVKQGTFTYSNQ